MIMATTASAATLTTITTQRCDLPSYADASAAKKTQGITSFIYHAIDIYMSATNMLTKCYTCKLV